MELEEIIKQLSLEYLENTSAYEQLEQYLRQFEKVQEAAYVVAYESETTDLNILKIGTILSFEIITRIARGYDVQEFAKEDWNEIAEKVLDYTIIKEGQEYTVFVFDLYAGYIDFSLEVRKAMFSEKSIREIEGLSSELRSLTESFKAGEMSEPDYVDAGLWICFDAMIKLLFAYFTSPLDKEFAEFVQSIGDFAVQYARLSMYREEQELLTLYLQRQGELDEELQQKYQDYIREVEERSEQFNNLVEKAFDPDFRNVMKYSAELARYTGVGEDEILDSIEKVDNYFS